MVLPSRKGSLGSILTLLVGFAALPGCGGDEAVSGEGGGADADKVARRVLGDGGPASASLFPVYEPRVGREATALAFNPLAEDELWVTLREPESGLPCRSDDTRGCAALIGKMAIVSQASGPEPVVDLATDDNAWHFLRNPTSIAFAPSGSFGTCGEARTANFEEEEIPYNGPVLWDPALFGEHAKDGMNGLHLDMLHETPFCMGIAHEVDNVYWAFNGDAGALDRYNFNSPHPPGGEDHSDGELWRYAEGELLRVPRVPSHLVYEAETGFVYVADTGHGRILRLDSNTGTEDGEVEAYDPIPVHARMTGATLEEIVPPGVLERPSGLALHQGVLFATDNATGKVFAFTTQGKLLRTLDTGFSDGSLAGITLSPGGRAFIADLTTSEVFRIDPL
jgi:hypothetical protein